MDNGLVAKIREAIRLELLAQFDGSSWWIDKEGLEAGADLVQIDGLVDVDELAKAVAAKLAQGPAISRNTPPDQNR